jgi:CIC family chloride channel protein
MLSQVFGAFLMRWFNDDDKSFATGITLGAGGNGGNFAPSLFVGSYLGYVFSKLINLTGLTQLPVSNFTMVGYGGI